MRAVKHSCQLKLIRLRLGISQRQVANAVGVSRGTIENAEIGAELSLSNARAIAAFFKMSVDELWPIHHQPTKARAENE
jgi:DNA-binding XRE family transcriptional regulator